MLISGNMDPDDGASHQDLMAMVQADGQDKTASSNSPLAKNGKCNIQ